MTGTLYQSLADSWDDDKGYRTRPVEWARELAKLELWSMQAKVAQSVADHRYTAVHACHDSGKTLGAAVVGSWWTDTHAVGTSFLVSTAPTQMQVNSILWREIIKIHDRAQLKGRINRAGYPRWFIGAREVGYGRKPSEYESSTFQGLHEQYPLVIIDEAGGISQKLYNDVDTLVTNVNGRVLAIGNPDDPASHFAKVCAPDSGWNVIHIDGLRLPAVNKENCQQFPLLWDLMMALRIPFSTEKVSRVVQEALLSAEWIEERIRRWCGVRPEHKEQFDSDAEWYEYLVKKTNGSALFQAKVRGVFAPASQANKVIPLGWVEQAQARWQDWDTAGRRMPPGRRLIGGDISRFGEDDTVAAPRQGNISLELMTWAGADTMESADNFATMMGEAQSLAIIDDIGIGAGVIDRLRRMRAEGAISGESMPFTASKQSGRMDFSGEFIFNNDRSAAWWRMRELLDPARNSQIALPPDEDLKLELCTPEYKVVQGGKIVVESKDEIKRRLQRSTDRADAVIQSYWVDGIAIGAEPQDANASPNGNPEGEWANNYTTSALRWTGYEPAQFDEDVTERGWDLVTR